MAVDQSPVPGRQGGIPLWVILAGGGGLALFLWWRNRQSSSGTQQPLVPGVVTDPTTGLPIDPLTGLPYVTGGGTQTTTLQQWATTAYNDLMMQGGANAAAISQALYDYTNGNVLSDAESVIIHKALAAAGQPPQQLPFLGNANAGQPPPPVKTITVSTPSTVGYQAAINNMNQILNNAHLPGGAMPGASLITQFLNLNNRMNHAGYHIAGGGNAQPNQSLAQLLAETEARIPGVRAPAAPPPVVHLTPQQVRWITAYTHSH